MEQPFNKESHDILGVREYMRLNLRFNDKDLEQKWRLEFNTSCYQQDLLSAVLMMLFSLQGLNIFLQRDTSSIPFFAWLFTGLSCTAFVFGCLWKPGPTRTWYRQHRVKLHVAMRILRLLVYYTTILRYYGYRLSSVFPESESFGVLCLSLAFKSVLLGCLNLQWQLPYTESLIFSLIGVAIGFQQDHTTCAAQLPGAWQVEYYRRISGLLLRCAHFLLPFKGVVGHTTVTPISEYDACMVAHVSFTVILGHLLPLTILAIDEEESRSWFLALEGAGSALLPGATQRAIQYLTLLPWEAAIVVDVLPSILRTLANFTAA